MDLRYSIFADLPVIARGATIRNGGSSAVRIETAMSAVLDLADAGWDLVQLSGKWAGETQIGARRLRPGRQGVGSDRGASSAQHNPFIALRRPTTTESAGEAFGFSLVYSGNFIAEAEVDQFQATRVRIGISPDTFSWQLEPGDAFVAPEAVLVYSDAGLGGMSDAFHRLYRDRLARGAWRDRPRPVLLNNWEATYFDFDAEKLVAIATSARDLGVELFVLDDGWFGARDDDTTSLGDWFVDTRKLPNGLGGLATTVESLGLRFGLWIEPEMVTERSRLFEAHPDWAVGIPGRPRTESRQQLVLDMSRPEIVDHLFGVLSEILAGAPISYVKWDMNRNITEPYSAGLPPERQGEFFHRYILGVYDLYSRLTTAFPEILFESCAGGGGRFDPGMLAYAPQAWTSDDTDAIERLRIQWGASLVYPQSSMGAHVAAVPNHQTGRLTPIETRAAVAFFGAFGYELDPTALSERGTGDGRCPGRVLQGPPGAVPAWPVGPPAQPVRGRWQRDGLDGRGAGPGARHRRVLPGAEPAGAAGRPAAAAGPRSCACLSRQRLAVDRRSDRPRQRRPPRRRRVDERRTVPSRRPARRCRVGRLPGVAVPARRGVAQHDPAPRAPAAVSSLRLRREQPFHRKHTAEP